MSAAHGHDDHGHGHDSHAHDSHGHDSHTHVTHTSADHGHQAIHVPSHGHDSHAHHATGSPEPALSWTWVITMLVCTVIGGWLIKQIIGPSARDAYSLQALLEQARPDGLLAHAHGAWTKWTWPNEHYAHEEPQFASIVVPATLLASASWAGGILLAAAFF